MEKSKLVWELVDTKSVESGLAVQVYRASSDRGEGNLYKLIFGKLLKDRERPGEYYFAPGVQLRKDRREVAVAVLENSIVGDLELLANRAEARVLEDMAVFHEAELASRREYEERRANYGKMPVRVTGKTERARHQTRRGA